MTSRLRGSISSDIRQLIDVLNKLVDRGNTVVVIEHNLDVVKVADWIIDIGPEGGAAGGRVLRRVRRTRWPPSSRVIRDVFCGKWGFNGL